MNLQSGVAPPSGSEPVNSIQFDSPAWPIGLLLDTRVRAIRVSLAFPYDALAALAVLATSLCSPAGE